ncbi:MAG TPA: ABC transporter ATP-binding protein [Clostridiaceae bacterium]|jgi:branched-chain amino acid transport system ATP-binding protein|nr:ABC transporter ATP-binding protein [Clostridiaceae bacterium]
MDTILKINQVTKKFGGIVAIDDLDMEIKKGQICGLIGPNGAGKTTIMNVITGVYQVDHGNIEFVGEDITGLPSHVICEKGIGRTFQNIRLLNSQTVFDNVRLGAHINMDISLLDVLLNTGKNKRVAADLRTEIEEVLDFIGLLSIKDELVRNIPYGQKKVLELGRVMMAKPKLLLLDEPAAGLNNEESKRLAELIRKINEEGISMLLIEHEMDFVEGLAGKTYVVNYGKKIAEGTFAEVTSDPVVISAYLGTRREEKHA